MRSQSLRALFIDPAPEYRMSGTDRGIDWVTDRFVIARVEVFKRRPTCEGSLNPTTIRKILTAARAETQIASHVRSTVLERIPNGKGPFRVSVVGSSSVYCAVDPEVWLGWQRTELLPRMTASGKLLWYSKVRGKEVLFGIVMPKRLATTGVAS